MVHAVTALLLGLVLALFARVGFFLLAGYREQLFATADAPRVRLPRHGLAELAATPEGWVELLEIVEGDGDPEVRADALHLLCEPGTYGPVLAGDERLERLRMALSDPSVAMLREAIVEIDRRGGAELVPDLVALLAPGGRLAPHFGTGVAEVPRLQAAVALVLGDLGATEAEDVIFGLLDVPDDDVVDAACRSLGRIGSPKCVETLLALDTAFSLAAVTAIQSRVEGEVGAVSLAKAVGGQLSVVTAGRGSLSAAVVPEVD